MNRLKDESSPYLLQHADNPVDWHPWGATAFQLAREQDKPVLLSIGYSACHWCHVMAHESFEDAATAAMMNALFVNIKVDREERPDVDDIYMGAVQALAGQGGWPLTAFLLPDGRPFYGGTYYPKTPRYGMPSFTQLLHGIHDAYRKRRQELEQQAASLHQALRRDVIAIGRPDDSGLNPTMLNTAAAKLMEGMDREQGGFGSQPKFPNPISLEFLLRQHARTGDTEALRLVTFTLGKMAAGGIYDQIGGGFARYSVDAHWLVPHFEKMLYDNAQLSRLYLHVWQITRDESFRAIAEDILDYILREMTAPAGGFYSATDADSEGEEGRFFVWTIDEAREALSPLGEELPRALEICIETFGMSARGNFEGANILHLPRPLRKTAAELGMPLPELESALEQIKARLYAVRSERMPPGLDDKILCSWNGLMLASLAEAARVFGRADYLAAAQRAGDFLLRQMLREGSRLWRSHKAGHSKLNGYLEDYANLIDALLELYQATYAERYFSAAQQLADAALQHFHADDGGFYDTSADHEKLIVRPRNLQDNVTPSGNGMLATQLLRLAAYTGEARYADAAREVLRKLSDVMPQVPQAFAQSLIAVDSLVSGFAEVALVGGLESAKVQEVLRELRQPYRPNLISAQQPDDAAPSAIPLLQGRKLLNGRTTVYVCRDFACRLPVHSASETAALLAEV
ncbi:MAG: thioredoxin domain-containing protein [Chloroflexi bacterium]|nr:thioredoxin domain-containing protein [Chloroflexota bacterium]MCY3581324.1 thioredoxin domain-containing protein [Chloroflexota bacterium]MCY3716686.1 thioredoxin domain-containing protein [Chloroflexota bacterium]MDE2649366.1 thioredoxin domain-containing protein [Chloroflexota bacterium]MYA94678.1 thioredoxin domain-containing protein [Chloroflexota bacterium]